MNERERVVGLVERFAESTGVPGLALGPEGVATFRFRGELEFNIEHAEESAVVFFYSPIAFAPKGRDREQTLAGFLTQNFLGKGTGGATISLDPETDEVFLHATFLVDGLTDERFRNGIENFLQVASRLKDHLEGRHSESAAEDGDAPGMDSPFTTRC